MPGTGSRISPPPAPSLGGLRPLERGRKLRSREGGGDAAGAEHTGLSRARSRAPGPVKVSLSEPQGSRCPETLFRAWAAESRGPLGGTGTPSGRQRARNRGTGNSRTERQARIQGRFGSRPRLQVSWGARQTRWWALLGRRRRLGGVSGRIGLLRLPSQVLGAAAMGEPALGAGDQTPLLPRPPRSRGPSPRARSRPAASPSRAAGPPPARRRPGLCL